MWELMRSGLWARRATFALLSGLLASAIIWSTRTDPRVTVTIQPVYGREQVAGRSYRWTPPETTVTVRANRSVQQVVMRQRLLAGPAPIDVRTLVMHTDAVTTSFLVQGGDQARVYSYLVPMRGHYLYGTYSIAPLQEQLRDQRPLGMAVLGSSATSLETISWLKPWMAGLLLVALLVPITTGWRGLALIIGATAIYFRTPELFLQPRFWAEEGLIYFQHAYNTPWIVALLTPHVGYFSLFNNSVAVLAAKLVPIEYAPHVTTLAAFGVQLVPFALVLWGRSDLWRIDAQKVLICVLLLFAPISAELWLTTICSQFFFSLIVFLVLLERSDEVHVGQRWLYRSLLVIAALTGPVSCLLTPLFVVKAWIRKQWEYRVQAGIMIACLVTQLTIFWQFTRTHITLRTGGVNMTILIATLWAKTIFVPLIGFKQTDIIATNFIRWCSEYIPIAILSSYIAALITVLLFWFLSSRLTFEQRVLVLGSYILVAIPSIFMSLGWNRVALISGIDGFRYFYVPMLIVLILIATHIPVDWTRWPRTTSSILCIFCMAVILINGALDYRSPKLSSTSGPQWELEAQRWRIEPSYQPAILPQGWRLSLLRQPS